MISSFYEHNMDKIIPFARQWKSHIEKMIAEIGEDATMEILHANVEQATKQSFTGKISCKGGCSFCCHDIIYGSKMEMKYIRKKMDELGIVPNQTLKEIQNSKPISDLKWAEKRCAMLDDEGFCTIYEHRPLICRLHNSADDPSNCDRSEEPREHKQAHNLSLEGLQFSLLMIEGVKDSSDLIPLHKII